jgi:preprotein translocase subunit SecG
MYQTLIVVHVLIALSIIGLVLLQQGRGADAGAGFGGGASGTLFGARGTASFLSRATAIMAALFFTSSILLAYLGSKHDNGADVMSAQQPFAPAITRDVPVLDANPEHPDQKGTTESTDVPAPAQP